ncbi:MAG: HEAT repeat domain-containing protein [Candidatus Poseidoniales archaeon]|nr:MAG: HEAT repeat domain-containing protein [Candidatus Poseidoniales archaeon]
MPKSASTHVSQLSHKDIRIRRRALRSLFELDSPSNLEAFVPLLDDKDPWFRSKALDAHRMWAPRLEIDSLISLATHKSIDARRCAANLLEKFIGDTSSVAEILYQDEDNICKIKASKALIKSDLEGKFTNQLIESDNERIKIIALSSKHISKQQLLSCLTETSNFIKESALNQLSMKNEIITEEKLAELLSEGVNPLSIIKFSVDNGGDTMVKLANVSDSKVQKNLVKALREKYKSTDDNSIKLLIKNECFLILGRWLQGKRDIESDKLRWQIIENEEVDEIERSRLLERLIGRCTESEIIDKADNLIKSTKSELLKITAQNLSTAGNSR